VLQTTTFLPDGPRAVEILFEDELHGYYDCITVIHGTEPAAPEEPLGKAHSGPTPLEQALVALSMGSAVGVKVPSRRHPRLPMQRPVRFRSIESASSEVGLLRNVSLGGACICTPTVLPPGTLLAFGFYLDHRGERRLLRCMAEVIWASSTGAQPGFGLRFVEPPLELLQTLGEVIQERLTTQMHG
jgi:hypothetical protein